MKPITDYEIIDHGIEHEQYFQWCGVAFTDFDDVATGIGTSTLDAADDAAESLAQADWDVIGCADLTKEISKLSKRHRKLGEEQWCYVSIRVK